MLLELGGVRPLTDPALRPRFAHLKRHGAAPAPEITQGVDAVLVSHLHLDHLDPASLSRLSRRVRLVVPHGAGEFLRSRGFPHVEELAPGQSQDVGGVEGRGQACGSRRAPLALRGSAGQPNRVRGPRCPLDLLRRRHRSVRGHGRARTWSRPRPAPRLGWGPTLGPAHLDPERAAPAAQLLRPRMAVPIHWGLSIRVGSAWETGSRRLHANSRTAWRSSPPRSSSACWNPVSRLR